MRSRRRTTCNALALGTLILGAIAVAYHLWSDMPEAAPHPLPGVPPAVAALKLHKPAHKRLLYNALGELAVVIVVAGLVWLAGRLGARPVARVYGPGSGADPWSRRPPPEKKADQDE